MIRVGKKKNNNNIALILSNYMYPHEVFLIKSSAIYSRSFIGHQSC